MLLNISAVARRTGVAADTLRKWERRYGVLRPERTSGGQRRYTQQDVARVEWLRDRLAEGWRIGAAAAVLASPGAPAVTTEAAMRKELRRAIRAGDTTAVAALLDQAFASERHGVLFERVLVPILHWLGEEWQNGTVTVAVEHAVSGQVRARLMPLLTDERAAVRGTAVLACAPAEQHDIGLLMLAVLLRADGWAVEYLGAATPAGAALAFAGTAGARLVCFSATQAETLAALRADLEAEPGSMNANAIVVGGAATARTAAPPRAATATGSLTAGVRQLRAFGR